MCALAYSCWHTLFWILGSVDVAFDAVEIMRFMNMSLFVATHGLFKSTQVVSTTVVQLWTCCACKDISISKTYTLCANVDRYVVSLLAWHVCHHGFINIWNCCSTTCGWKFTIHLYVCFFVQNVCYTSTGILCACHSFLIFLLPQAWWTKVDAGTDGALWCAQCQMHFGNWPQGHPGTSFCSAKVIELSTTLPSWCFFLFSFLVFVLIVISNPWKFALKNKIRLKKHVNGRLWRYSSGPRLKIMFLFYLHWTLNNPDFSDAPGPKFQKKLTPLRSDYL